MHGCASWHSGQNIPDWVKIVDQIQRYSTVRSLLVRVRPTSCISLSSASLLPLGGVGLGTSARITCPASSIGRGIGAGSLGQRNTEITTSSAWPPKAARCVTPDTCMHVDQAGLMIWQCTAVYNFVANHVEIVNITKTAIQGNGCLTLAYYIVTHSFTPITTDVCTYIPFVWIYV